MSQTNDLPGQTIELDCPPGAIRPWDLILGVIEGTGLADRPEFVQNPGAFFGHATWEFNVDRQTWERDIQPVIKPRIVALHEQGYIRYGSW